MDIHRLYKSAILIDMDNEMIELLSYMRKMEKRWKYRPTKSPNTKFPSTDLARLFRWNSWLLKFRALGIQRNIIAATPIPPEQELNDREPVIDQSKVIKSEPDYRPWGSI